MSTGQLVAMQNTRVAPPQSVLPLQRSYKVSSLACVLCSSTAHFANCIRLVKFTISLVIPVALPNVWFVVHRWVYTLSHFCWALPQHTYSSLYQWLRSTWILSMHAITNESQFLSKTASIHSCSTDPLKLCLFVFVHQYKLVNLPISNLYMIRYNTSLIRHS